MCIFCVSQIFYYFLDIWNPQVPKNLHPSSSPNKLFIGWDNLYFLISNSITIWLFVNVRCATLITASTVWPSGRLCSFQYLSGCWWLALGFPCWLTVTSRAVATRPSVSSSPHTKRRPVASSSWWPCTASSQSWSSSSQWLCCCSVPSGSPAS